MRIARFAAAAAVLALGLGVALAATRMDKEDLAAAELSPSPDAYGRLTAKYYPAHGKAEERSWLRLQAWKLEKKADYRMFVDDPTVDGEDFQPFGDAITTRGKGNINSRVDTKKGGALPFGKTLDELGGASFQLRDSEDAVVLVGLLPTLPPLPDDSGM